ncbi:DUF948 domain-containing protein [Bacillus seohaeanensis]|uniref:DUF948 domain-containing protein n=1 Tax=Bacillus seohaeanensis TaxID=284580 RepID=A0ABW5RUK5_9BACI
MELILYLSVAVIAIAFFILVISVIKTMKSLQTTLDSVSTTLNGLEGQLQGITKESTELLHKTNLLAEDIQKKSENLNTVVYAVKDVGQSIQTLNTSVKKVSSSISTEFEKNQGKISQIVQWGNAFIELKDKWKQKKEEDIVSEPAPTTSRKSRVAMKNKRAYDN